LRQPAVRVRLYLVKNSKFPKWLLYVVIAIVVLGSAIGGYLLLKPKAKPIAKAKPPAARTQTPAQTDSTSVDYKSTKLGLELTHRKDWTLTADANTGAITLTSPGSSYQAEDGSSKQGSFTLRLSQGTDNGTESYIHAGFASLDSVNIAYTAPLASQFNYTNITVAGNTKGVSSFLLLSGQTTFKVNDALSTFFMNGDSYVILGGFGTFQPDGTPAFDSLSTDSFTSGSQFAQAVDIIKSLKIS
jgi:hypothetical protein